MLLKFLQLSLNRGNGGDYVKRRCMAIILIIVLVATGIACNKEKNPAPQSSTSDETSKPTKAPVTETPNTGEEEEATKLQIAGEKANALGTLYAADKKMAIANYTIEGCYYYDNDTLILLYRGANAELKIGFYNIYSGTIEKTADFDYQTYIDQCTVSSNGNIFLSSTWSNSFLFLDKELNKILYSEEMTETFSSVVSAHDGTSLYYIGGDGYTLYKYNAESKVSSLITTFSDKLLSLMLLQMTSDDNHLTVQYSNSTGGISYLILNIATKEILDLGDYSNNLVTSGKLYSMADYDYISKGYIETFHIDQPRVLSKKYFVDPEEGSCFQLNGLTNSILTVSKLPGSLEPSGGGVIRLYNADNMQVEKMTEIDRDTLLNLSGQQASDDSTQIYYYISSNSLQVSLDKKTAILVYSNDGYTGVLIWDLVEEPEVSTSENPGLAFVGSDEITAEDNDQYVDRLAKEYGVNIYIRDKVVRYFPDFAVNAMYDENVTNEALKLVEKVLSRYPKGFFKELKYGSIKSFDLYLCGTLVQGSEYGISNPGGFALQYRGSQMIVMDVSYSGSIETSLSHEIMHAMESRMEYLMEKGKLKASVFDNWYKLNPKDHDYRYGYLDDNGLEYDAVNNALYTPNDEKSRNNVDNIYYIDYYANTFPNEDRARIFENLMMADTELSYEFNSKHLKAKAIYLCKMIRATFKSVPDDELAYWERFLGEDVFKPLK